MSPPVTAELEMEVKRSHFLQESVTTLGGTYFLCLPLLPLPLPSYRPTLASSSLLASFPGSTFFD